MQEMLIVQHLHFVVVGRWKWLNSGCFPCLLMTTNWLQVMLRAPAVAWARDEGCSVLPRPGVIQVWGQEPHWEPHWVDAVETVQPLEQRQKARMMLQEQKAQALQERGYFWKLSALSLGASPLWDSYTRSVWLLLGCAPGQVPFLSCAGALNLGFLSFLLWI